MIALKRAAAAPREPDERDEIALTLLECVPVAGRTLLLELLARSFVDAYAVAERSGSVLQLIDWADRMCDANPDAPAVRDFFAGAAPAMAVATIQ